MLSELSVLFEKRYHTKYDLEFSEGLEHVESCCGATSLWRIVVELVKERKRLPGLLRT